MRQQQVPNNGKPGVSLAIAHAVVAPDKLDPRAKDPAVHQSADTKTPAAASIADGNVNSSAVSSAKGAPPCNCHYSSACFGTMC